MTDKQSEAEITSPVITAAATLYGSTLLRNNSGAMKNPRGQWVRFGLGNRSKKTPFKSSDYIGPTPIVITQEMVGMKVAVMTAVELKKPGWRFNPNDEDEVKQQRFIEWLKSLGGLAGFASSVDDLKKIFLR